jgi:hypothetical protein
VLEVALAKIDLHFDDALQLASTSGGGGGPAQAFTELNVVAMDGTTAALPCRPDTTVSAFKALIHDRFNKAPNLQRLSIDSLTMKV